jgi:RNA polymerase sigma factor (sigma-70 family)
METVVAECPPALLDVRLSDDVRWTEFYRAEYPRLAQALTLYCADRELAAELAQEAMARAWRDWARVGGLDSPGGWVHRVGINLAGSAWRRLALRRRTSLRSRSNDVVEPTDVGPSFVVREAVARLPKRQRTALVLRYFVDLSIDEVAGLMGCRPGTVAALTSQAIANLRKHPELLDIQEMKT